MKTYIINLDKAVDRWERIERLMAKTGIAYERVPAVLGKSLELPIPEFSEQTYKLFHGKRPNLGQIGCYLSHIKTLKLFLETGDELAMICEDDITPSSDLADVVSTAWNNRHLWDILRLSGFHNSHPRKVCTLDSKHHLAVSITRLCGTGCYAVKRDAAKVLVEKLLPMRVPIDHALDREWFHGLRALTVDPLPVEQNPTDLPTSLPQLNSEKLPAWQRYWTVFPYRAVNEVSRFFARSRLLRQSRLRYKVPCDENQHFRKHGERANAA